MVPLKAGVAFANVSTPCHQGLSGAYNEATSVVWVQGTEARLAPFASIPSWVQVGESAWPAELSPESDGMLFGAAVRPGLSGPILEMGLRFRALGDSGWWAVYAWNGEAFEMVEFRYRNGGAAFLLHPGPYPIWGPPERRCRPVLEPGRDAGHLRLVSHSGRHARRREFRIHESHCRGFGMESVDCGPNVSLPDASYSVISREQDWVVLRVGRQGDTRREVLRTLRRCSLDSPEAE